MLEEVPGFKTDWEFPVFDKNEREFWLRKFLLSFIFVPMLSEQHAVTIGMMAIASRTPTCWKKETYPHGSLG